MSFNVALDRAPALFRPSLFFINAFLHLLLFIFLSLKFNFINLDRFSPNFLVCLHVFTVGFLLNFIWGALVQLLPVLFGIDSFKNIFYWPLWLISLLAPFNFIFFFQGNQSIYVETFFFVMIVLYMTVSLSLISNLISLIKNKSSLYFHIGLLLSFISFFIGLIYALVILLHYWGVLSFDFRTYLTNQHALLMVAGFLIPLIMTIASKVIPMFYVTDGIDSKQMYVFYISIFISVSLFLVNCLNFFYFPLLIISILLISTVFLFKIYKRRRKKSNVFIISWQLLFSSLVLGLLSSFVFEWSFESLVFSGMFWIIFLVLSMYKKIYSFLLWLHLNNFQMKSMNFSFTLPTVQDFYIEKWHFFTILFFLLSILLKNDFLFVVLLIIALETIGQSLLAYFRFRFLLNNISSTSK